MTTPSSSLPHRSSLFFSFLISSKISSTLSHQSLFHPHHFSYLHNNIPQSSTMDTIPFPSKETEEAKKEQQRETCSKGACDYQPSKSESDTILPHILNLYGSRATPQDFEIYAPDASFEDPLMCAHGVQQIKSAFYSLSKIFSESRIVEYSVTENLISPGRKEILIDNKQHYKIMGKEIDMISLIKLQVEEGKVVRHEDWWDKKPLTNRDTATLPLVGRVMEMYRRSSMMVTHAMMRFGKDPTV